ncbi:hypothetical protein HYU21_05045 [Candidatus Woesearchaeota archaeon]|nr:hypothetical protein [Candidatus Woesearchaeota archaeon]
MIYSKREFTKVYQLAKAKREYFQLREEISHDKELKLEYFIEHINPNALIAVYLTDYFPENGIIKPTGYSLADLKLSNRQNKIVEKIGLKHLRMTIHFTLNFAVTSVVNQGQVFKWSTKYAILIPVKDFIERLICLTTIDSWIIGPLRLPTSAEILIPEKEYLKSPQQWQNLSGRAKLMPYSKDKTIQQAVALRIIEKGYSHIEGSDHGWRVDLTDFLQTSSRLSYEEKERLKNLCNQKGLVSWAKIFDQLQKEFGFTSIKHETSFWRDVEKLVDLVYSLIFAEETAILEMKLINMAKTLPSRLDLPSIPSLRRRLLIYSTKVKEELDSERYNNKEEKKALLNLMIELNRIERWLGSINKRIDKIPKEEQQNYTWKQFLKKENLI